MLPFFFSVRERRTLTALSRGASDAALADLESELRSRAVTEESLGAKGLRTATTRAQIREHVFFLFFGSVLARGGSCKGSLRPGVVSCRSWRGGLL